ncbi:MAG: hypothetical protein Q8T09_12935 [Candidatus Melainabacteria bacterium]|nr:hypothetical protein [Candidatus Melainabacteria bacterium]
MQNPKHQMKNIMIASPCTVDWNTMDGDDSVRVCGACKHNVYDTSKLTSKEIVDLMARDSKACLKIYRRADGTLLTEDCPFGLRTLRRGARRVSKIAASLWALALSFTSVSAQSGTIKPEDTPKQNASSNTAETKAKESQTPTSEIKGATPVIAAPDSLKDTLASDLLTKARTNIAAKNYIEAEQNFKDATSALTKSNHDIFFERQVWSEYSNFLISQNRKDETTVMANELKRLDEKQRTVGAREMNGVPFSPTVIDIKHYCAGRAERHQNTAPTLPNGAPIPDNE